MNIPQALAGAMVHFNALSSFDRYVKQYCRSLADYAGCDRGIGVPELTILPC